MKQIVHKNKYELLFDEFLETVEFKLIKCKPNCLEEYNPYKWKIYDLQGANLGDIDLDTFANAEGILDRMDIYIQDYYITDIVELLEINHISFVYNDWTNLLQYKDCLSKDYSWEFDILDMICCHANEINLENCNYTEE